MIASSVRHRLPALCSALLATLCLRSASAEGESSERAQQLFDDARALMKDGRYAEACPKLAESQKLDPGGGTILNLGICLRQQGQHVEAWNVLTRALAQARHDGRADREKTAEKHLAALSSVLPRLVLRLSPADSPVDSPEPAPVTVTIDGVSLSAEQLGNPVPLEPGTHEVRAAAAQRQPWSVQIHIESNAGEQQLIIPALQPEVRPEPPPVIVPPPATAPPAVPAANPVQGPRASRSAVRPEVYAAFGVGALALGVGTYFGIRSLSLKNESNRHWDGQYCTAPSCVDDWNKAQTSARVSDIGFGVGLLALGVGTYFLLQPSSRESAAPTPARIQVRASQTGAFLSGTTEF